MLDAVAVRYAGTFLSWAQERECVALLSRDLEHIRGSLEEPSHLRDFVKNPVVDSHIQRRVCDDVLTAMGAHPVTRSCVLFLVHCRRLHALALVIDAYILLALESEGKIKADVVVADTLSRDQEEKIQELLGKNALLHFVVDPTIIGGFIIKMRSRTVDLSLARGLLRLEQTLKRTSTL